MKPNRAQLRQVDHTAIDLSVALEENKILRDFVQHEKNQRTRLEKENEILHLQLKHQGKITGYLLLTVLVISVISTIVFLVTL